MSKLSSKYKENVFYLFFIIFINILFYSCYKESSGIEDYSRNILKQKEFHLDYLETASLFNDSLKITLELIYVENINSQWLYVLSKELGESRKLTNIEVGDTFKIVDYDIIILEQIIEYDSLISAVKLKVIEYK